MIDAESGFKIYLKYRDEFPDFFNEKGCDASDYSSGYDDALGLLLKLYTSGRFQELIEVANAPQK